MGKYLDKVDNMVWNGKGSQEEGIWRWTSWALLDLNSETIELSTVLRGIIFYVQIT